MTRYTDLQPMPNKAEGGEVWPIAWTRYKDIPEWLVADAMAIHARGTAKYGTGLRVHNGRNSLIDAYQEAMDCWVYCEQTYERAKVNQSPSQIEMYARCAERAYDLAKWLGVLCHSGECP